MKIYGAAQAVAGALVPLSQAVELDDIVYLSGQLALSDTGVTGDVQSQTHLVLDRISAILSELGLSLDNIFRVNVWLREPSDFRAFNLVYAERLRPPYPVRSCVLSRLVLAEARVEIEVTASRARTRG